MKRFRIILAGCGAMAPAWVPYVLAAEDAEFVGLVSPRREPGEALRARFGLTCPIFPALSWALEGTQANLVFDVTPAHIHRDIVTTALTHGYDVFGEKPMAADFGDALAMAETAARCGRTYSVMQNRRYLADTRAMKALYEAGAAGEVGLATCAFFNNPGRGTLRDTFMEHPLLFDMAVHQFDMARFIFGADAVAVTAQEFTPPGSWFKYPCSVTAHFEMSNGMRYQYTGCYTSRAAETSWEAEWRAEGSGGALLWDKEAPRAVRADGAAVPAPAPYTGPLGHDGCLGEMFDALRDGKPSATDCRDNLQTIAMTCAAALSAERHCRVALNELF